MPARSALPGPRRARLAAAALLLGLAGCGGGIAIGIGIGVDDINRGPPSVSIAASPTRVAPGQAVQLVAAASDENGIDVVAFFRLDNGQPQPLGTLGRPPYELTTTAPNDGRTRMTVFARAIDNLGSVADSQRIDIEIVR
ncbi:Ig-like domain-containing protein [Piscinibacter sakaiensis]|uniref:Chitodextrinase n=2 Tax=Piscinibacter sakaiensis TaxID=1547922 RepID=A0A0K8P8A1_PISS1|nr:Ig-like domain-containing protein [Piscinibacter sakaiensis]GAP38866.1 Chitodextrinase precursor [Piscinibacter sakaiensis]